MIATSHWSSAAANADRPGRLPSLPTAYTPAAGTVALRRLRRTARHDRIGILGSAVLRLISALAVSAGVQAQAGPPITIVNALPSSTVCPNGNSVSVFAPGQQVIQPGGPPTTIGGDFSTFPGFGLQVNNWYWTRASLPVQKTDPQNPDNSGAQFAISDQCVLTHQQAWYGQGIPTYLIATVAAEKTADGCKVTIGRNSYTDAVTPTCCAPPGIGSNTCTGPWGITNGHVGEPWPPR